MAAIEDDRTTTAPTRRQNALAEIHFASIVDDDDLTPSEDESPEERQVQLEDAQSAIGVSIGQQQTRLISPKTPAAEKAAALDELDGGGLFDGFEDRLDTTADGLSTPQIPSSDSETEPVKADAAPIAPPQARPERQKERGTGTPPARLPSPWRAGPKTFQERVSDHRSLLRQTLPGGRRRASSGSSMGETVRKFMPFNLPSLSRSYKDMHFSLPSFSALSLDGQTAPPTADRRRRGTFANSQAISSIPQHDGSEQSTRREKSAVSRSPATTPPVHPSTAPILQRDFGIDSESTIAPTSSL